MMSGASSNGRAYEGPLHAGVTRLLAAIRTEEWVFARALCPGQLDESGTAAALSIKELVAGASAARRTATKLLHTVVQGGEADGCEEAGEPRLGTWTEVHRDAHAAMSDLWDAVERVSEDQLAADAGPPRSHPQYLWRDVVNLAVRGPFHSYADWHLRAGRVLGSLAVLARWYEAVRGPDLPTKARSDASYDLACGLARVGRLDAAMEYLPDAFSYNDRAAVPVLKAWAREDADLAPLRERADFRTLVGV
jgi:hypothetical protein